MEVFSQIRVDTGRSHNVMRYLYQTKEIMFKFSSNDDFCFVGYVDSDFTDGPLYEDYIRLVFKEAGRSIGRV